MRLYPLFAALLVVVYVLFGLPGCGQDLVFPGMFLPTMTPTAVTTPTCGAAGAACSIGTDCCSGSCITPDGVTFQCQ